MAQNSLLDLQEMKPTPRNQLIGLLADALTAGRDFADRAKVPAAVPLLGGQGLGSLLLGKAPEELTEISYGNMPLRINPLAGRTASFVPEIKPGRQQQVADLVMALQGVPGGNRAALGALGAVDTGANKAAIVWHGSPHKFDKFDASKIGTGEGAQAYGHGIYTASSPEVARSYQVGLSPGGKEVLIDGVAPKFDMSGPGGLPGTPEGKINNLAIMALQRHKDLDKAISSESDAAVKAMLEKMRGRIGYNDPGNLYKVDLPDNMIARMLDWDKPLSQQAPEVRAAVTRVPGVEYADDYFKANRKAAPTGADIHEFLRLSGYNPNQIAPRMSDAGIPGIRYLDGGSRGVGAGTSNFVVFPGEEQFLRILERNGGLLGP